MKIHTRTVLILGITVFILVFTLNLLSQYFILASYQQIEQQNSATDVKRVTGQMAFETAGLSHSVSDWAIWNSTYQFMADRNPEFIDTEINPDSPYDSLQINGLLLYDTSGNFVAGRWYDIQNKTGQDIPRSLLEDIENNRSILPDGNGSVERKGLMLLPEGPVLISMHTILPNSREGPGRGTLIMARFFNQNQLISLENRSAVSVHLTPLAGSTPVPGLENTYAPGESWNIVSIPQNASIISGYTVLPDISGKPVLLVQVDSKRAMYSQVMAMLFFMMISSVLIGILVILVMILLLHHYITRPLSDLDTTMKKIGTSHDISLRLPDTGDDEIASLNGSFNTMLADLEEKETELARRDRELTEANRKATLYLDIYLDVLTYEIMNSTHAIRGFADLILQGGDEASCKAYAKRISAITLRSREIINNIETISKIFKQPPKKIPVNLKTALNLAVDSCAGPAVSCEGCDVTVIADEMLTTVFDNLISNSIKFGGPEVKIGVSVRDIGEGMVEVTVADNGPGIPYSFKPGVFDRFQTGTDRRSSYGLGLHIAKMLIEAYGGRIWADDRVNGKPEEGAAIRFTLKTTDMTPGSPE